MRVRSAPLGRKSDGLWALGSGLWALGLAACAFDVPGDGEVDWAYRAAENASRDLPEELYYYDELGEISSAPWTLEPDDEEVALVIVDGDLAIGTVDEVLEVHREIEAALESEVGASIEALMLDTRDKRKWPGTIRYTFDKDYYDLPNDEQDIIGQSIIEWNRLSDVTGIRWVHEQGLGKSQHGVRFDITKSGGCNVSSVRKFGRAIGRFKRRKDINLQRSGCININTVMHEMAHIMGARHEQKRNDRDAYIKHLSHNAKKKISQNSTKKNNIQGRHSPLGSYDPYSVMHYYSAAFSKNDSLPTHLNSHIFDIIDIDRFTRGEGAPPTLHLQKRRIYNRCARLGNRGIDLSEVRVGDLDGDGLDDLLTEFDGGLVWSARGSSCWRPIEPGGEPLSTRLSRAAVGNFTTPHESTLEVVEIDGRAWTLVSSDGTRRSVERDQRVKYFETFQFGAQRRIFVILADGAWAVTPAGDPLGALDGRSHGSMGVSEVRLVDNRDIFAFKAGELLYIPLGVGDHEKTRNSCRPKDRRPKRSWAAPGVVQRDA